jgi:hypothetical protein
MRVLQFRRAWAAVLLLVASAGAGRSTPLFAQETPAEPIDCGPVRVLAGDFVSVNVGHPGRDVTGIVVVQARLLDGDGDPLASVALTLAPGQSRSLSARSADDGLVRGEIVPMSGPSDVALRATVQVTQQRRLKITYGPTFECSGPTASRGPV